MFTNFNIGNEEYKLRLRMRDIISAEKKLGKSLMDVLMDMDKGEGKVSLIKTEDALIILWASMQQMQHSMSYDKVLDLIDDNNVSIMSLMEPLLEVIMRDVAKQEMPKEEVGKLEGIHHHQIQEKPKRTRKK